MTRYPAVAGQFYPAGKEELLEALGAIVPDCPDKVDAVGAVVPHAGYIFSGAVAGEVYARIKPGNTYVVIGPNHSGRGERFALSGEAWHTPLGEIDVDRNFLAAVKRNTGLVTEDPTAHSAEHSIEVQLPFIQKISPGAKIVPIAVQYGDLTELHEIAGALFSAKGESSSDVTVLASSDMTHYESRESAEKKDKKAIQKILDLDAEGLMKVVEEGDISMCGYIPACIMLLYAKMINAKKSELVRYSDSGEVTGDIEQVVGYAGIIIH